MTAIAVVTTVGNRKEARRLARALVEARLAACAHVSRIESVYAWKGAIEQGKEYRVLFKTIEEHYPAAERAIRELHAYELPARIIGSTSPMAVQAVEMLQCILQGRASAALPRS